MACKKEVEIKEGPFKVHMESVEYEPAWSLGANCGNDDIAAVANMIDRATTTAIDAIEIGNVLSMYMEATEKGYTNGDGGSPGATRRHGRADRARSPAAKASATYWPRAPARPPQTASAIPSSRMTVKGQGIPAYDPRGIKGMGIGYATSNRGACHLRGYTPAAEVVGNVLGPPR